MKKGVLTMVLLAVVWHGGWAQSDTAYIDYNSYLADIKAAYLRHLPANVAGASQLKAEVLAEPVSLLPAISGKMGPEAIFTDRKKSVFVLGMLERREKDSMIQVRLARASTAFAITEQGVCVTNYHVLKGLIHPDSGHNALYFIATGDKQVYFIDEILGYSQNNDIAVFRANTRGTKLKPIPIGRPAAVGAPVYCISHPNFNFYYFSAGMVARNVVVPANDVINGYDPAGRTPLRMEISADYAVGSSGGPVLDQCGNLIGIVSATANIGPFNSDSGDQVSGYQQMVLKKTIPVKALTDLLKK